MMLVVMRRSVPTNSKGGRQCDSVLNRKNILLVQTMEMVGAAPPKAFNALTGILAGAVASEGSVLLFGYFLFLLLMVLFVVTAITPPHLPHPSVQEFETLGLTIIGRLVALVWRELMEDGWIVRCAGRCPHPKHLLWSLLFLKIYGVEEVHAARVGCDEKTFRKWAWLYAEAVAKLDRKFVRVF